MRRPIAPSRRAAEIRIRLGSNAPDGLLFGVLKAGSRRFTPFVAKLQSSPSEPSDHPKLRRILLQTQVTPVFVIIADELSHYSAELPLVKHEDLVQQLSAQGASESLHIRILPG